MADTDIYGIQLRRGPQSDLPGEPTPGNPGTPTTGLAVGEPIYTTDTGRMFVGSDPQQGGPTATRATFPYTNIEVLTELASDTLQTIFDGQFKDVSTGYYAADLALCSASNADDWRNVQINLVGNQPSLVLTKGANIGFAQIVYFLFDANLIPVRTGKMAIFSTGSTVTPILTDEGTTLARSDAASTDPAILYGSTQFRAVLQSSSLGAIVVLQYRNIGPTVQSIQLRVERAQPTGG